MASGPLIVGLGGTTRPASSSGGALGAALAAAAAAGATTRLFDGSHLARLPLYEPDAGVRTGGTIALIESIREADGVVIASPGYHGGVSGLVKNALDYLEDLREDERPYLTGRAVGCIACAAGWQATVSTLAALRAIVHALRGWPTPMGAAINSAVRPADREAATVAAQFQLETLGSEVVQFARAQAHDGVAP
ncbi:MAG: reductase [Thermoleophilaceae bacterium]|nr:reductase [Thermoleophilaceae bacterium]